MARTTSRVDGDRLVLAGNDESPITVGTPAWFTWLETATTFAFTCPSGKFTARKEARTRGSMYWKAYHTAGGTLYRAYLGKTSDLTLDCLAGAAAILATDSSHTSASTSAPSSADASGARSSPAPVAPPNLLATKLNVPAARAHLVVRPRLFERLEAGLQGKLTLIAAPAGFGKTTLISAWRSTAAGSAIPLAWLSLDPGDNDPLLFWSYVFAALDTVIPGIGTSALSLLQSPQPLPVDHILTSMLNALTALPPGSRGQNVALVLEDYHVITTPAIHAALSWLLDSLPATLHLVIVTRADPTLPLARFRVSGDLTEIHADDLRFTAEEVAAFLNQIMGLALTSDDLRALEARTEGWIAGLQLAALALRDNRDRTGFIRTFSGNNRYIVDYLAGEVFERQPAHIQNFLLHTSILDRMCGPLCDAVLERIEPGMVHAANNAANRSVLAAPAMSNPTVSDPSDSATSGDTSNQDILEELERTNLFVVPLDEERHWYRYHHLFADVLRQRLTRSVSGAAISALHEHASVWYEGQGLVSEAVRHALMVDDASRAAQLLERHGLGVIVGGQVHTAIGWLSRLPEALLLAHPLLSIYYALGLLFTNELSAAEVRLQDAERCIRPDTPPAEARNIQGYSAAIRANMALYRGDLAGCVAYGEQVLRLLPETELIARTTARLHVARAFRVTGDVTVAAERRAALAVAPIRATGSLFGLHGAVANVALLQELQGRLRAAAATYREIDQLATGRDDLQGRQGSPAYDVGLGDLHREWNELDAADGYLLAQAMDLLPNTLTVDADYVVRGYTALARLQHARGQHTTAQETLATFAGVAERRGLVPHLVTRGAAVQAQLALAAGNLSAAVTWADESGLYADDEISFPREGEYLVLARVWIARAGRGAAGEFLPQALQLLDRLMADASETARQASVLEILIVRALALEAQGDHPDALATTIRALSLAASEGYVRRFVDEGPAMLSLLRAADAGAHTGREAAELAGLHSYIHLLLAAFAGQRATGAGEQVESAPLRLAAPSARPILYEPLSDRELEVLRLIATGRSNAEVAQVLVIALSTVKTHTNTIFGKLGVSSRTQAVARARDLQMI